MPLNMLLRLYGKPIAAFIVAVIVFMFLRYFIPGHLVDAPLFSDLANKAFTSAPDIALIMMAYSLCWGVYRRYLLWRCETGKDECCRTCGGPLQIKIGRYSNYCKCLCCGNTSKF